jgi:hypothetical protein
MGTGRSGLSKGLKSAGTNTGKFEVTTRNLSQYNMAVSSTVRRKFGTQRFQEMLDQVNKFASMLGLTVANCPNITIHYKDMLAFGDCNINRDIRLDGSLKYDSVDTLAHEYSHAIESWLAEKRIPNAVDRSFAWVDCTIAKQIIDNALTRMHKPSTEWQNVAKSITRFNGDTYAQTNHSEMLSVAVQHILRHGENATPAAKIIIEEYKKAVQSVYNKKK